MQIKTELGTMMILQKGWQTVLLDLSASGGRPLEYLKWFAYVTGRKKWVLLNHCKRLFLIKTSIGYLYTEEIAKYSLAARLVTEVKERNRRPA